jgi:hypothetical protein
MTQRGALAAIMLFLAPVAASAQQPACGPTGKVEKRIHDQYGETIVGAGVVAGGILFTLANPISGSFTILLRRPDGQTCVLMGGTGYATIEAIKPGTDL